MGGRGEGNNAKELPPGKLSLQPARAWLGRTPQAEPPAVPYGTVIDLQKYIGCKACMVARKADNHTPRGVSYMLVLDRRWDAIRTCGESPHHDHVCSARSRAVLRSARPGPRTAGQRGSLPWTTTGVSAVATAWLRAPMARSFDFGHDYYSSCEGGPIRSDERFLGSPIPWDDMNSPEYGEYRDRGAHLSPYQNVRKCHFCLHRVKKGMLPACASVCPGRAIYFGDLNDPESIVYRVRDEQNPTQVWFRALPGRTVTQTKPETGNDPAVYYLT